MFFRTALLSAGVLLAVFGAGVADVKTDAIMDDALVEILWEDIFEEDELTCWTPDSIKQCFISEGIPITGHSSSAGVPQQQSVQDQKLTRSNTSFNKMCQPDELPRFQRAISCVMNEMVVQCLPPGNDYKSLIPDPTRVRNMLDLLCKNAQHLNIPCYRSLNSALNACLQTGDLAEANEHEVILTPLSQVETIMCSATRIAVYCDKEVLPPCGCMTTYTFVEFSRYLSPATCHIDVAAPVCDPHTFQFISGGASGLMQLKAWPLAAVSLLIGRYTLLPAIWACDWSFG